MNNNTLILEVSALALTLGLALTGCEAENGGGGKENNNVENPAVTSVTVSPATPRIKKGGSRQFTAAVEGTHNPAQTVTWSIVETNKKEGTAINAAGLLAVDRAETLTTFTVKAVSTLDDTQSATAAVTLYEPGPLDGTWEAGNGDGIYRILFSGTDWVMYLKGRGREDFANNKKGVLTGESPNFTCSNLYWWDTAQGIWRTDTSPLTWILYEDGRLRWNANGIYFTKISDEYIGGDGWPTGDNPTVTNVKVNAESVSVAKGGMRQFTATVEGANNPAQTVMWSIVETNKHENTTIAADGTLTMARYEPLRTVTVKATSTVDTSKSGTAAVTVTSGSGLPPMNWREATIEPFISRSINGGLAYGKLRDYEPYGWCAIANGQQNGEYKIAVASSLSGPWTAVYSNPFDNEEGANHIASNNTDLWVATGFDGAIAWTSTAKQNWSANNNFGTGADIENVVYANSTWVVVGGTSSGQGKIMWTSGHPSLTWTTGSVSGFENNVIRDVAYGNSKWVAVGYGKIRWASTLSGPWAGIDIGSNVISCVAYGNGKWVVGRTDGKFMWTSDPAGTWTTVSDTPFYQGGGHGISDVAYANGKWVMVGTGPGMAGLIAYASDPSGIWETLNELDIEDVTGDGIGNAGGCQFLTYANGTWVVGGSYGEIAYSND